jgi:XTP/dITP diphosphohydrolase
MKKILIATTNSGKFAEISSLLSELPIQTVSLKDVGIEDDVEETGRTYEENSQKKALFYANKSGLPAVSDDGGMEIEALDGMPGLHSKRWVGEDSSDEKIIEKMKEVSKGLGENRRAFFRTVVSLALPSGQVWSVKGQVEGIIAKEPQFHPVKGFPYRSFFYLPQIGKYYQETELTIAEKKEYNHRYKALQNLKPILKKELHL